jgi:BASS family bile acid:Na+ symporter
MLLEVVLPLSLAVIMFSLGVGLTIADFRRVVAMPRAVTVGLCLQLLGIPVLAFCLLQVVNLQPALAFGVMLLAFCPAG